MVDNYHIFNKNRKRQKGGGVAVLIKRGFTAERLLADDKSIFEICWVNIRDQESNASIICAAAYFPPKPAYSKDDFLGYVEESINNLNSIYNPQQIILAGDFNSLNFKDITDRTGLLVVNKEPTRGTNTLDYIFVSYNNWDECRTVKACVNTDHKAIILLPNKVHKFNVASKIKRIKYYRPHSNALIDKYLRYMNIGNNRYVYTEPFKECNDAKSFDIACDSFNRKLLQLLDYFFPLKHITINSTDPAFVTAGIKKLLRKRNALMRRGRISEADNISDLIRNMIITGNSNSCKGANTRKNQKDAWQTINHKMKSRGKCDEQNQFISACSAEDFNNYYAGISTNHNYLAPKVKATATKFNEHISAHEVRKMLLHLKATSAGPDSIPYWFLKLSADYFKDQIADIINYSIYFQLYPSYLKCACIRPIPKTRSPNCFADYRPISVTNVVGRLIDRVIAKKFIYPAMILPCNRHKLLNQYGFCWTGSCENALIAILDNITAMLSLKQNKYVALINFDMSKAFDVISHHSVLERFADFQIPDEIHNWLASYLDNRQHTTFIKDTVSKVSNFNSGVVQGSGLGPLLFVIAMTDYFNHCLASKLIKYADDCYLIFPSSHINEAATEITCFYDWVNSKNLSVNTSKTKYILFTSGKNKHQQDDLGLYFPGIIRVQEIIILGVSINYDLSFSKHIDNICKRCNKLFYLLRMLKAHGLPSTSCRDVFIATIVSVITYCILSWYNFCKQSDLDRLHRMFRRGTKLGYIGDGDEGLEGIVKKRSEKLFNKIISNEAHVLYSYLPPVKDVKYDMRLKGHKFSLPTIVTPHDCRNFLIHMLYL